MIYYQDIYLKNGKKVILRNGTSSDGEDVLQCFNITHMESDYLFSYPDENKITIEE